MFDEFCPERLGMNNFAALKTLQQDVAACAAVGFIRGKKDEDLAAIIEGRTGVGFGVKSDRALIAAGLLTFLGAALEAAPRSARP